jgi:hypothetical protein
MQSDDQFRLALDAATARLDAWAERHGDCAEVSVERVGNFWRLSVMPHAANACPVELILHRDTQNFDLQLGLEAYERRAIGAFDLFEPLLDAVVAGHVVTRHTLSAAGGIPLLVETIIQPDDQIAWIAERQTSAGSKMTAADTVTRDRHWVPYRRG